MNTNQNPYFGLVEKQIDYADALVSYISDNKQLEEQIRNQFSANLPSQTVDDYVKNRIFEMQAQIDDVQSQLNEVKAERLELSHKMKSEYPDLYTLTLKDLHEFLNTADKLSADLMKDLDTLM